MEHKRNSSDVAEFQSFILKNLEPRLRIGDTMNSAFESRKAFLSGGLVFHTSKEMSKCFVNSIRHILCNLGMNRIFTFNQCVVIKSPEYGMRLFIGVYRGMKKIIIDCFAGLKSMNEFPLLFLGRIESVCIRFDHGC